MKSAEPMVCRTGPQTVVSWKEGRMVHTWMMKGVSFFLLIALSSIVSGTERLIILLKQILKWVDLF